MPKALKPWLSVGRRLASVLRKRPKGYKNYLLSTISESMRSPRSYGAPVSITIEPSNFCNLRCPVCETGAGILGRAPHLMAYDDFVKIMNKVGPGANHVMFYFMGEAFLNKEAYRMIRYARDMGLFVMTCTNGDVVEPMALYESGINQISFQIGGITQETHETYRRQSKLQRVLENASQYMEIFRTRGRKPGEHIVEFGFIVMRHNEHEVEAFLKLAKKMGVDRASVISPCVRTPDQGDLFLPVSNAYWIYDRELFEKEHRLAPKRILSQNLCPWLYYAITIQVDGHVVPCCRDPHGRHIMGNLIEQSLEDVWNGERFMSFRQAVYTKQSKVDVCRLCPGEGAPLMR